MVESPAPSVGVVVLTYNAGQHLYRCLPPLLSARGDVRVLVIDSSSTDGSADHARALGADTIIIEKERFNHGATREFARKELGTDIAVLMTQDAYPVDESVIEKLVEPIRGGKAAVAYARQVPRARAGFFESFPRRFNYGGESHVRGLADIERYGSYTYFCSNACAAYSNRALDEVGGFVPTLSHEDAISVAMLLSSGHRIAYVSTAVVEHSHDYTLREEFERYFDAGYARARYRRLFASAPPDSQHGARMVREMLHELLCTAPWLLPYALAQTTIKWSGYRVGTRAVRWSAETCRWMSGQRYFWHSAYFDAARDRALSVCSQL